MSHTEQWQNSKSRRTKKKLPDWGISHLKQMNSFKNSETIQLYVNFLLVVQSHATINSHRKIKHWQSSELSCQIVLSIILMGSKWNISFFLGQSMFPTSSITLNDLLKAGSLYDLFTENLRFSATDPRFVYPNWTKIRRCVARFHVNIQWDQHAK